MATIPDEPKCSTDEERLMVDWIRGATHEQLLRRWRFSSVGDPMFQGMIGEYYSAVMFFRRKEDPEQAVQDSKAIGWADRNKQQRSGK